MPRSHPNVNSRLKGWPSTTRNDEGSMRRKPRSAPFMSSTTINGRGWVWTSLPSTLTESGGISNSPVRRGRIWTTQVRRSVRLTRPLMKVV